jgi:hypothetical protein
MALIVRIDVDRPYGRKPLLRHVLSRISSDYWLPKVEAWGYLNELNIILQMLNRAKAHSYAFFRRCTLPSRETLELLESGSHEIGLHLEDSRNFDTFLEEKQDLEKFIEKPVTSFSKHGSGGAKFGRLHHAPYEPEKYLDWGSKAGMKLFLGNLEDPTIDPKIDSNALRWFPSAFWLEPSWRDLTRFPVGWLVDNASKRDVVILIHPENVLASTELTEQFSHLINTLETKVLS